MDWAKAKREYVTTGLTLREVAADNGISYSRIRKVAAKEKWQEQRNRQRTRAEQKTVEKTADLEAEARTILYRAALDMARRLAALTEEDMDMRKWKPKDITGALRDCREILDVRSEKDLKEQDARIAKLEREAAQESENKSVTVRIEGVGDGWQN